MVAGEERSKAGRNNEIVRRVPLQRTVYVGHDSRDGVEDVAVEVGIVHDGGMPALFASAPLRTEAVVEALAVAPLAAAHVVSVGVHPQEPHQRVQFAHL